MKISSILKQKRTWSIMLFYVLAVLIRVVSTHFVTIDPSHVKLWDFVCGLSPLIGAIVVILALRRKMKTSLFGTSVTKSILTLAVPFGLFGIVDYKEIGLCLWLLFIYLLYAFFEEVGWRGYLYSELIGCKIIHRLLLTTLLWFFWHCRAWQIGDVGFFALLFLASFGLDKLIRDTHSLILVACFHGLFNFYFKCLSDPSHWSSIVCLVITIMLWLYIWYGPKVKICGR